MEVQVMTVAETEVEIDGHHDSGSITDSLLSSAQKIINSSPNSAGPDQRDCRTSSLG